MKTARLAAAQRGIMRNREFWGYALFSNGVAGTNRLHQFGAVHVFNDDYLFPISGLGMHPHANVEIITVMVAGRESHEDNMGYHQELDPGAVQLISAGRGMQHAGGNLSDRADSRHLQIWVTPRTRNTPPSVQLKPPTSDVRLNQWVGQVSPTGSQGTLTIQQDLWLYQGAFDPDATRYSLQKAGNGVLIYVLEGIIRVGDVSAGREDTLFVTDTEDVAFVVEAPASLLLMETQV